MKKSIALLTIIGVNSFMAGCTSAGSLQPGADKIVMATQSVPKSCRYLRQVSSSDINGSTQMYTSHKHLQADEINAMRNQALKLGANVVVVTDHRTTYVKRRSGTLVDVHEMSGNAYACPANALNYIAESNLSDVRSGE